ncbi:tRNA threonylcarbamoyladenosine dehydratase [Metallumcola ferriviriculae]|uniref:tRNA threonylcarbamoyladenosine dehydratase n=1 Tax=Metallumcola ferriviriculae TaxID=3039180 RepID=A0AAU0UTJ8_9FIRM|nr:tRNA threonylcarbamoyladenosine dehydratase [Desulfitibacteraceae bacterium MK1]
MLHKFSRTELLIGPQGVARLTGAHVAVFGVGGVGSYAVEALVRAGVGRLTIVDYDDICLTNINRQLHALYSTVGRAKVEVMAERIKDINPDAQVNALCKWYLPDQADEVLDESLDYIIDAIDTVTAKLDLIEQAFKRGIPIVSAMGAGNKLNAAELTVADISETRVCPLAKVMRKELRKRGISTGLKVVYSPETPMRPDKGAADCKDFCICPGGDAACAKKRQIPGSISFVPPVSGMLLAGEVVNQLLKEDVQKVHRR